MALALAGGCSTVSVNEQIRAERMEQAVAPMASAALDAGQIETAQRLYTRLLEVDPESATARSGLGDVALVLGRPAEAAHWYGEAAEHAAEGAERRAALLAQGRAALAAGDLKGARATFAELAANPADGFYAEAAWGFNGVGVVDLLEGDPFAAATAFEAALRLAPNERRFGSNLARARELAVALPDAAPAAPATTPRVVATVPTAPAAAPTRPQPPSPVQRGAQPALAQRPAASVANASEPPAADIGVAQKTTAAVGDAPNRPPLDAIRDKNPESVPATEPAETPAERKEEKPKPAAAAPSGWLVKNGTGEYLQVGAFAVEDRAQRAVDRLSGLTELPVRIEIADRGGRPLHRVRVGPIESRSLLPDLASALGIDAGAIRMPWPTASGS